MIPDLGQVALFHGSTDEPGGRARNPGWLKAWRRFRSDPYEARGCSCPGGLDGRIEDRVLGEHRLLHPPEPNARVQAEVIEQPAATLGVGVEGLGLEAGSIESKHQQLPASLSIRLLCRQLTGLGDQLGRPAMVELQGEQFLPEPLDQLFEAARPRSWPQAGLPGRPAVGRATGRVLR